jgi:hypothetical protein
MKQSVELTELLFERYKCFEKEQKIEVRPLTVLIGANSSGKSVIARLPLFLAHAFSERAEGPLDLTFDELDFGGKFSDLIYNRLPHASVRLGASFLCDGKKLAVVTETRYFEEVKCQLVEYAAVTLDDAPIFSMTWRGEDPIRDSKVYDLDLPDKRAEVMFRGLLPEPLENSMLDEAAMLVGRLRTWVSSVHYLGPFRSQPQRLYWYPQSGVDYVGHSGSRAAELLASDALRNKRTVLGEVAKWYAAHLGGWTLDLEPSGDGFSLVLVKPDNTSVRVNLMDVGTGIAQVLPMVVQRHHEASHGLPCGLEIVEQPELHLHPQAHGDLADLYITAVKNTPARFLIETHSEIFLLRIRQRIATGDLDPSKVVFYWTTNSPAEASPIVRIDVDARGEVNRWPTDVFADAYKEVMAIRRAQREKRA